MRNKPAICRRHSPQLSRAVSQRLLERFPSRQTSVGVIGLGYVGLPLAAAFARAGLKVIGFDTDEERTAALGRGESWLPDAPAEDLRAAVGSGALAATTDFGALAQMPGNAVLFTLLGAIAVHRPPQRTRLRAGSGTPCR